MTLRSNHDAYAVAHSLPPAIRTTGTSTGATVDLKGFDSAAMIIHFGDWTDGTHTPLLQHSGDAAVWENVPTAELFGAFSDVSGTVGENTVQEVGYGGSNRYLRAVLTVAAGTNGAASAAVILRGHAARQPI